MNTEGKYLCQTTYLHASNDYIDALLEINEQEKIILYLKFTDNKCLVENYELNRDETDDDEYDDLLGRKFKYNSKSGLYISKSRNLWNSRK